MGASPTSTSTTTRATVATLVAQHLTDEILAGRLRAGDRLVAESIARELGVSRVPVREALQHLDGGGLVELHERRGASVADFDLTSNDDLLALLAVRRHLEPWAVSEAARRRTAEDLAALEDALDTGRAAERVGDLAAAGRAHHELLAAIARSTHNRHLVDALTPLHHRTIVAFALVAHTTLPDGWADHERLIAAITAGDPAQARRIHAGHLDAVVRAIRRSASVWLVGARAPAPRSGHR